MITLYRVWNGLCVYNLLLKQDLSAFTLRTTCVTISSGNVPGVNGHIWSWEVPVPVKVYFTEQWSRFCGLGSKFPRIFMKQWLQYCSVIKLLFQQYVLEKLSLQGDELKKARKMWRKLMLVFRIWAMSVWSGRESWNVRTTTSEGFSLKFVLAICYLCYS